MGTFGGMPALEKAVNDMAGLGESGGFASEESDMLLRLQLRLSS